MIQLQGLGSSEPSPIQTIASIIDLILLNPPFDNPKMIEMCSTILNPKHS